MFEKTKKTIPILNCIRKHMLDSDSKAWLESSQIGLNRFAIFQTVSG